MDYEKKYKEALEKARCYYVGANGNEDMITMTTTIFPELKESEDERIRKALIEYFNEQCDMSDWNGVYGYQVVAWLEKQGEQKPAIEMKSAEESLGIDSETYNKIVDECIYGEQKPADKVESNKKFTPIESALKDLICDVDNSYTIEQVRRFLFEYGYKDKILNAAQEEMQKSAWSEEDEKIAKTIINEFEQCSEWCCANGLTKEDCIAWLKSLRPQNRWKPSAEQIKALETTLHTNMSRNDERYSVLSEFVAELKKLKG